MKYCAVEDTQLFLGFDEFDDKHTVPVEGPYRTMLYFRQSRNPDIVTKCSLVVIIFQNNMQAAQEKKGEIILQIMMFLKCIFELILSL